MSGGAAATGLNPDDPFPTRTIPNRDPLEGGPRSGRPHGGRERPTRTRGANAVDVMIHLPAQTMVDVTAGLSVLTMGAHYEAALLLLGDLLVLRLLELTNQKREDMYTRYTNMK